jgi:hypothetical protein
MLNIQLALAQNNQNNQFISEIVNDNYRVEEKATDIGLKEKAKTVKVVFQEIKNDTKTAIEDAIVGYFINFDENTLPTTYYKYKTTNQFFDKSFFVDKINQNSLIFNSKKIIEKHIKTQDLTEDLFDKNGNLIETSKKYIQEVVTKISDSLLDIPKKEIFDFNLIKYTYNKQNKIIEQIEYEKTFDKTKLIASTITKNKYNPSGKVIESEIIEPANTVSTKRNITNYSYNPNNQLVSVINKITESSSTFKYNPKKELVSLITINPNETRKIEYTDKRVASMTITDVDKNLTKIDFVYTNDVKGNWVSALINIVSTDAKNNKTENKYEFLREIEYY